MEMMKKSINVAYKTLSKQCFYNCYILNSNNIIVYADLDKAPYFLEIYHSTDIRASNLMTKVQMP